MYEGVPAWAALLYTCRSDERTSKKFRMQKTANEMEEAIKLATLQPLICDIQ
jgi:hypothetical protein